MLLLRCLSVAAVLLYAEGRYTLEVQVLSFNNPSNRDYNGGCCDTGGCGDPCEVYFFFCLRDYLFTPATNNLPCGLGSRSTRIQPISASSRTFTGSVLAGNVPNPVPFASGNAWPGQFQMAVRVEDDDADSNDLLDRVIVNQQLSVSQSFTSTITQLGVRAANKMTMKFRFRVRCDTNYYGSDCTAFCVAQTSDTFTCGADGQRACKTGYSGVDCLTVVCAQGCDQGSCSQPGLCDSCFSGWSGDLCDVCQLEEGCDGDRAFCEQPGECQCNAGYSGMLCQNDVDVCGHLSPCMTGSTCTNTGPDAYSCACAVHFTGTNCQVEIDMCDSSPCLNGATCERTVGAFNCTCATGWTGQTCEDDINECAASSSPCQNGGTCTDCTPTQVSIAPPAGPAPSTCPLGYTCACTPGFFGDNCQVDVDFCTPAPCQNGATCHDVTGGPGYTCECPPGYEGDSCEADVDECGLGVCQNGASCTNTEGSFSCSCPLGFTGLRCETNIDDCPGSGCNATSTRGICQDGVNDYFCSCYPGYTGVNCEEIFNECDEFPCMNGGNCTPSFSDFSCACPAGFSGIRCSIDVNDCVHPDLCLFGGTCVDEVDDYMCLCDPGHTGNQCETDFDPCTLDPCPSATPVCLRTAEGFQCDICNNNEAGCVSSEEQGGNNGTQSAATGGIIGGVVGGVVLAVLLLLLLLLIICCCCKNQCCCCCCGLAEEKEEDVTAGPDHAQNNPLYFGVSTIVSSTGDSISRYKAPTFVPTTTHADNGGYATTAALTSEPDHHYEYIPAQFVNGANEPLASGSYAHLQSPQKQGQQNGTQERQGKRENPYVMEPLDGGRKEGNAYAMGAEARARRDMYMTLPTPEQQQQPAAGSGPRGGELENEHTMGAEARARQAMYTMLPTPEQLALATDR